jgi:DNA primase
MMMDDGEILVDLIRDLFGKEKQHYESKGQIAVNCPMCDENRNKGNLEINYIQHVFKCWSCAEVNEMKGPLGKLIDQYANKKQKKIYSVFKPEDLTVKEVKKPKIKLPESYVRIMDSSEKYPVRRQAYTYLKNRGIDDYMIRKYQIGFCDKGSHMGRIIVPSFDKEGELNYYIARSWDPHSRAKYKNPDYEKDKIIFNESIINWKKDIFLVEGVFDGFFVDNSIPLLGKYMSDLLFNTIYEKARGEITIGLDGDAFKDAVKLYEQLNGGRLFGKIKILKLPNDKDICDLRGNINEYYYKMKH